MEIIKIWNVKADNFPNPNETYVLSITHFRIYDYLFSKLVGLYVSSVKRDIIEQV